MQLLIIGLPNAGKTTYSKRFKNVIHWDDMTEPRSENFMETVRRAGDCVVVEGVFNTVKARRIFLDAVKDKQGKKVCIWLQTPLETCLRRAPHNRPEFVVMEHFKNFERPELDEGWDEIQEINEND